MDSKNVAYEPAAGDFTVCDLADEEVHFSRNSSEYYYCRKDSASSAASQQAQQTARAASAGYARVGPPPRKCSSSHSIDLTSHDCHTSGEQASSNRLLNSLSSRLRRGSNYLNAPAKLLGQYLLGITIQSWSEFFNTSRMGRAPCTRHQLSRRLAANLSHFQGNYLCVSLVLVVYCILTSPLLLLAIAFYLLALYLVTARSALGKQTRVLGYRLNLQQQYSFITMAAMPPLWIAGAPSAVFWVIGASFFVIGLHASMFASEQLEPEQQLSARASHHSLASPAAHAQMTSRQPVQQQGYAPIGYEHRPAAAPKQYYNHYPAAAKPDVCPPAGSQSGPSSLSSSTSYVSSALSQWAIFGGNQRSTVSTAVYSSRTGARVPEVKVISRDYAGLGRVYEV